MGKRWWILFGAAILGSTVPAVADWLVMKDGTRVETRKAWKVKGSRVIFTMPNGTLSSLRLDDVDLDASALATARAEQAKAEQEQPLEPRSAPEPVAVLTNQDIARARPPAPLAEEPAEEASASEGSSQNDLIDVDVVSWNELDTITLQGVEIRGLVRNKADKLARELVLTVTLFDSTGEVLAKAEAFLGKTLLQPGATTDFRALFPGITSFSGEPGFQIQGRGPLYGEITGISDPRDDPDDDEEEEVGG